MESKVIVFSVLMLASCVPVDNVEPDKELVTEQPVESPKPVSKPVTEESKADKKAVNNPVPTWDCRVTDNKVINQWKLEYRCDGELIE